MIVIEPLTTNSVLEDRIGKFIFKKARPTPGFEVVDKVDNLTKTDRKCLSDEECSRGKMRIEWGFMRQKSIGLVLLMIGCLSHQQTVITHLLLFRLLHMKQVPLAASLTVIRPNKKAPTRGCFIVTNYPDYAVRIWCFEPARQVGASYWPFYVPSLRGM